MHIGGQPDGSNRAKRSADGRKLVRSHRSRRFALPLCRSFPLRAVVALAAFCVLVGGGRTVHAETSPSATLRIASEGARPPYNYIDNNELAGFEIDLGRALCAQMKVTCTFVTQDWDGLISGLRHDRFDAIMAAMEITDARREKIDFSKPYVRMPPAFIASTKSGLTDATPNGLAGKSIGVESDSAEQQFVEDVYKQSDLHRYGTLEDAELDLAEGRIDTVVGDKDVLDAFLKTRREGRCCRFMADVPRDANYFGDGIGIGLRKSDPALKTRFDAALDALTANGTFATIAGKYFDFPIN